MKSILLLAFILGATCTDYLSSPEEATITHYFASKTVDSCHLQNYAGEGFYRAAINEYFYQDSAQCGICYELTGEKGSINIQITEKYKDKFKFMGITEKMRFEIDVNGFSNICDKEKSSCSVTYKMIPCEVKGGIAVKIKEGVTFYLF